MNVCCECCNEGRDGWFQGFHYSVIAEKYIYSLTSGKLDEMKLSIQKHILINRSSKRRPKGSHE